MTDVYEWVTKDCILRKKRDLEEMQTDPERATSANAYSWIKKGNIVMEFAKGFDNILDIGCGWGRELCRLENAVGVDISKVFLRTARNYVRNQVILADAYRLPFKDDSFSFLVISEVIEHLADPMRVLVEIKRVLKPKGKLLIQTPNRALTLGRFISSEKRGHIREFTFAELKTLLGHFGFTILRRTGSTIPYIPSTSRFETLNSSRFIFPLWKFLDKAIPLKWDIIILSESPISK
jgi:ubiquinone/menaquinone biosynthesis C-methylase UbiE